MDILSIRIANIILISVGLLAAPQHITDYGSCLTPNLEHALCIELEQCPYLFDMFLKTPWLDNDLIFLRRSHCGVNNGSILICCPDLHRGTPFPEATNVTIHAYLPEPGICGQIISDRIYGGNETGLEEFPWMALIEYVSNEHGFSHNCGGSLINDRYILTAAHCITDIPAIWTPVRVRLGEWNTQTDPDCAKDIRGYEYCADPHVDVPIENIILHPSYVANSTNKFFDIALIRLSHRISYSDYIRPICLPLKETLRQEIFYGSVMDVAGWGLTTPDLLSNVKMKASVSIVSLKDCQLKYAQSNITVMSSQICAGSEKKIGSCRGDSGGPLIGLDTSNKEQVYYFIAGIISYGTTPCGLKGWPGVYTKVSDYIDWIQQVLEP